MESVFHVAAYLPPLVTFATLLGVYLYIACCICCFGTLYLVTVWPFMYFLPTTLEYHRAIFLLLYAISLFILAYPGSTDFRCCRITRSLPFGVMVSDILFNLCSCTQFHAICFPLIVSIASTIIMSPSQFILKISLFTVFIVILFFSIHLDKVSNHISFLSTTWFVPASSGF